jgi:ATP-dependent RNA helicase DeaD
MNLKPEILKAIKRSGFEEATPIQEKTIPLGFRGKRCNWSGTNWYW